MSAQAKMMNVTRMSFPRRIYEAESICSFAVKPSRERVVLSSETDLDAANREE
jgi:hypothetical protein